MIRKKEIICFISSGGGHLTELINASSLITHYPHFFVTINLPHISSSLEGKEVYYILDPHTSIFKYFINFIQALKIYLKKRPKIIITTGAGIAIPMCVIGKLFGSKIVYIESGARVNFPSKTGKFMYKIADLFIVQWKPLLKRFPNAVYGGPLF